jgi:hypothetical protein
MLEEPSKDFSITCHLPPMIHRLISENARLQALLYSMNTPGTQKMFHFGWDTKHICIYTRASACLSTKRSNFTNLKPITNLKINGIASRLLVEGIITLKWPIKDDNDNEIDLYIHNVLYVPNAPMGLLCPQQIAQQTQHQKMALTLLHNMACLPLLDLSELFLITEKLYCQLFTQLMA